MCGIALRFLCTFEMDQSLMKIDDTENRNDAKHPSNNLIINIQIQGTLDKMDRRDALIKNLFFRVPHIQHCMVNLFNRHK